MNEKKLSRRELLKTGCVAATSFAAPMIIPSSALGKDGALPPSERVTLGHIGVGSRGGGLFNRTQNVRGVQSLAVADCFQSRRDSLAVEIQGQAYADFRELLDRSDIDGVIVATPDHWHVPIALLAARAGKDAYVEKPLGVSLEHDLVCQKVFQAEKRIFQYGTQQREAKHQQIGRELVRSGQLGELKAIEVKAPNGGTGGSTAAAPVPAGFDYDMWSGPAPEVPYTVDRCKPYGGTYWTYDYSIGYLAGWGAHPLDIMVWCYDGDQSGPYTVEGTGEAPTEGLYDTVINWNMTLRMADGVKVTFKPDKNSTKFVGTKGKLELTRGVMRTFPKELLPSDLSPNDHGMNIERHIQNFADSIRSRQPASSPIDESVRSDVMSHLCDIAVRTGERITWDPAKQQIIGGSKQAQAMASRPLREPWTL